MFCDQCKLNSVCHRVWKTSGNQATNCVSFTQIRTNADGIRQKTDKELAEWIESVADCIKCPLRSECRGEKIVSRASCYHTWLDWLRKEAPDEKTAESFSPAD